MGELDIEKVLVSKKISFAERNYQYFIGYLYDNHKVKAFTNKKTPLLSLLIINKYYTMKSIKHFF